MPWLGSLLRGSNLLTRQEADDPAGLLAIKRLAGDGSSRRFWRIKRRNGESVCLAVAPAGDTEQDLREARAARLIGCHLLGCGVRVPAQLGWDEQSGVLFFEDLGDVKLHDLVDQSRGQDGGMGLHEVRPWYIRVVQELAVMQIRGAVGFNSDWCWDTRVYDQAVMLGRESGYFLRAFWRDLLGQEVLPGCEEEFEQLAMRAAQAPATFFLHRDFQSRNIMISNAQVCFIDFQGGRWGPLGYDLASLLIDPYVALPMVMQEELIQLYLEAVQTLLPVDVQLFRREYSVLALQRNLQIIGAFSFLSRVRGKTFFSRFLVPALESLVLQLHEQALDEFRVLPRMAAQALKLLADRH